MVIRRPALRRKCSFPCRSELARYASAGWLLARACRFFTGSPAALSIGYERLDADFADVDRWKIGIAWQFGTDSLRQASQTNWNGANRTYQDSVDALF